MVGDLIGEGVKDMTPRLVGEPYKRRTSGESTRLRLYALYECQYCKKEFEAQVSNIKNGGTKSCGCLRRDMQGLRQNRFYSTWHSMKSRCINVNNKEYKNYGGRGITVCKEWLSSATFIDWCESTHPNIKGMTLDRIDNDKGYSPDNCRWADIITQAHNQRMKKNNTSGFVGIYWNNKNSNWRTFIHFNKVRFNIGSFHTIEEAVLARDNYIIENKLPHKLSTDYKREEKINE